MHNKLETASGRSCWFDLTIAQSKGSVFWQPISDATTLNDSMPADCLVKVVNRQHHEILCHRAGQIPKLCQRSSYVLASRASKWALVVFVQVQTRQTRRDPMRFLWLWYPESTLYFRECSTWRATNKNIGKIYLKYCATA